MHIHHPLVLCRKNREEFAESTHIVGDCPLCRANLFGTTDVDCDCNDDDGLGFQECICKRPENATRWICILEGKPRGIERSPGREDGVTAHSFPSSPDDHVP